MKATINSLHHQEIDWMRELEFYEQELGILYTRLVEVKEKNTSPEIKTQVEHFEKKFTIEKFKCDTLLKENTERNERLGELAKVDPEHIEDNFSADKDSMNERINDFFDSFRKMRYEFNNFLAKVL